MSVADALEEFPGKGRRLLPTPCDAEGKRDGEHLTCARCPSYVSHSLDALFSSSPIS